MSFTKRYYLIPFIWRTRVVKFIETKLNGGWLGGGGNEELFNEYSLGFVFKDEKVLEIGCTKMWINILNYWTTHLKMFKIVNIMLFYHN